MQPGPSTTPSDPEAERRKVVVWAIVRMTLGIAQMSLALTAFYLLLSVGTGPATIVVAIAATCATILSRLLFGGVKSPPR